MNIATSACLPDTPRLAYHMACLAAYLPTSHNPYREQLHRFSNALRRPNLNIESTSADAEEAALQAVQSHATQPRPETWLLCAVAALLKHHAAQAAANTSPSGAGIDGSATRADVCT